MENTGITRAIDQYGRLVIPIEIKRQLGIGPGTEMKLFLDGEDIVMRKHEKACLVTGKTVEEPIELFGGNLTLSKEGAQELLKTLERWV
ncbi:AbrB/MazE/SpoVT family DNA-binding domain-containing protein [Bacillus sp. H7(2023)]|uniref:AbrB/MazE/SpoVT family DNA-binding domain-containing protein n=1 Tax=Bacillus sp. H7(2023) TaxID=3109354 RepID=UPI002FFD756F